jgi:arsenate reductase (glutaredoxin)
MTYRKYKETYEALSSAEKIDFIIANTSLIKRPVLVNNEHVIALGFDEKHYEQLISSDLG